MNREWAIEKLKGFLHTAAVEWVAPPHGVVSAGSFKFKNASKPEAQAAAHIAEQILDRVIPDWRTADWEEAKRQPLWRHREAAHRAVAFLEAEQELQENLGSGAPSSTQPRCTHGSGAACRACGTAATFVRRSALPPGQ